MNSSVAMMHYAVELFASVRKFGHLRIVTVAILSEHRIEGSDDGRGLTC